MTENAKERCPNCDNNRWEDPCSDPWHDSAAPAAPQTCPRCYVGIDDDGDGNCAVCARLTDREVERLRRAAPAAEAAQSSTEARKESALSSVHNAESASQAQSGRVSTHPDTDGGNPSGFDEATETRWQSAIYELCKKAVGHKNDHLIDGGGCDSGDALDVSLSEIAQAIEFWRECAEAGTGPARRSEELYDCTDPTDRKMDTLEPRSEELDDPETWRGIEDVYKNPVGGVPAGWEQNPQSKASSGAGDTRPPLRNEPTGETSAPRSEGALSALKDWVKDTGLPASASEGNAFMDGFRYGWLAHAQDGRKK